MLTHTKPIHLIYSKKIYLINTLHQLAQMWLKRYNQLIAFNYTNMHISESIFIQSICVDEVLLHIDLLDSQKPVTLKHDIHVRIMKISKYMLSPIPTIIFNNYNCIVKGIYPDALVRGISRLGSAFIFLR